MSDLRVIRAVRQLRRELAKLASSPTTIGNFMILARRVVERYEKILSREIREALFSSFVDGATDAIPPGLPNVLIDGFDLPIAATDLPTMTLPVIVEAANDLTRKRVMLPEDFATIDNDAKRTAFTVARAISLDTIERVQTAIADDLREGGTLRQFRRRVSEYLDPILSPSQIEAIYRTHEGQAYSAGQRAALNNPLVRDEFPYVMWAATHDTRVEPSHLAMESHGLNGTAIYRADDPIWRTHSPPVRWNCRCKLIPLSLADAASYGVKEAQQWLRTGTPPTSPKWIAAPHPANPPKDWPTVDKIATAL